MKPEPKLNGVILTLWTEGFFFFDSTPTPMNPVVSLHFLINGEVQHSKVEINNPIELNFMYSSLPSEEIEVVEWDESNQSWANVRAIVEKAWPPT